MRFSLECTSMLHSYNSKIFSDMCLSSTIELVSDNTSEIS
ncbi:hypothetical protein CAEBREN_20219 [Caenorhabditis brenneri]|uniref:Uncharacterized protein n=1 Tax=Caenorhabditis brenneri TaxID=135651 RepID=G0NIT1_CAEBE|nr:hypothetical protein CAEBREN_20219 [Caenorhabditis brenneri]